MKNNAIPIAVTAIILALGVIAGGTLVDSLPNERQLEKADQMTADPYENEPWWSVGAMPLLISTVFVLFTIYIVGGFLAWWKVFGVAISMRP